MCFFAGLFDILDDLFPFVPYFLGEVTGAAQNIERIIGDTDEYDRDDDIRDRFNDRSD